MSPDISNSGNKRGILYYSLLNFFFSNSRQFKKTNCSFHFLEYHVCFQDNLLKVDKAKVPRVSFQAHRIETDLILFFK